MESLARCYVCVCLYSFKLIVRLLYYIHGFYS